VGFHENAGHTRLGRGGDVRGVSRLIGCLGLGNRVVVRGDRCGESAQSRQEDEDVEEMELEKGLIRWGQSAFCIESASPTMDTVARESGSDNCADTSFYSPSYQKSRSRSIASTIPVIILLVSRIAVVALELYPIILARPLTSLSCVSEYDALAGSGCL
jgi:hypothetical protein